MMDIPYPNYQDAYLFLYQNGSASIYPPYTYDKLECYDNDKPSKSILDKAIVNIKKQNCKDQAKQLIASSDWSVLPDVNISNKSEFENYRTQLRNLIINPVEDPIFPKEPNPIWSNN